jgi:5-oxoprolinase (ATP-hydrolysing)
MARTAEQAGFHQLIGFDMGGTSTDVCHYNGEFERVQETAVAGIRVRVPMLNIHTVAAGGGSIVRFDGARFRVGPQSAGANPGPACYRRSGPLAVTDCNVLLGRIQPDHFPHVFGKSGDQPIAVDTVQEQFAALADEVNATIDAAHQRTPEEVAEGFLRIAVENMANAIKKISVQRGYDITTYALHCFGGAGGQHACLVADALSMNTVLLHPLAGVLSAYGMGLADVRALRERQVEKPLDTRVATEIADWCGELADSAIQEVRQQAIASQDIQTQSQAQLRYRGAHQSLTVAVGSVETMTQEFETAHRTRFGFSPRNRELTVEAITVEAIGAAQAITEPEVPAREKAAPIDQVRMRSEGQWVDAPVYDRATLAVDQNIPGPAMIIEPTGTNIVEPGWQASLNRFEHLLMQRTVARRQDDDVGTHVDPVMLEVFNNLFMSIAEQMGATLANTAYSVNIKERYDFSCALFDAEGYLVANAPHVPVHLGSMSAAVRALIADAGEAMRPSDVYVGNVPFKGGTHLPDVTVITPVFDEAQENIIFFVGSRGHHADIGGRTPGSSPPDSTHIKEEGVLLDNIRMIAEGQLQEDELRALLASGDYPCRNVD